MRLAALALLAAVASTLITPVTAPARAQVASPASEATGTIGIALADTPSGPRDDPRAHRYIVGHLDAGESTTRRLEIRNDTDSSQRLEIYAAPATVDGGRFLPTEPGATSPLSEWIQVDTPVVQIPPRSSTEITATITAPRSAPSREHYGVIWASHTSASASADAQPPAGMDLISRVGVRVYLSTGDQPPADPDFQIIDLRPIRDALGVAAILATVANIGGRAVDITGTMQLTDGPGGLSTPAAPSEPVTLAPGETAEVPFRFTPDAALPPGEWRAALDLASGTVRRESVQPITLEPAMGAPGAEGVSTGSAVTAGLLGTLLVVLVVIALLAGWRAVRRHRT